jgi:hypothetical protein
MFHFESYISRLYHFNSEVYFSIFQSDRETSTSLVKANIDLQTMLSTRDAEAAAFREALALADEELAYLRSLVKVLVNPSEPTPNGIGSEDPKPVRSEPLLRTVQFFLAQRGQDTQILLLHLHSK